MPNSEDLLSQPPGTTPSEMFPVLTAASKLVCSRMAHARPVNKARSLSS
ncbi:MAG TPA: hypothetical protein VFZ22_12910 [Pyrinomonadaceae bacterium]|nr:hypothetical protein [Pyrinomonadaceae bacterium]